MRLGIGKMLGEFRDFAFKGNMIDMAVGIVIGAAFTTVINAIVNDVVMPLVTLVENLRSKAAYAHWRHYEPGFQVHHFISTILNFILMAAVVFFVIVKLSAFLRRRISPPTPAEPTTKECPKCLSIIPLKAVKCAHCTADLV